MLGFAIAYMFKIIGILGCVYFYTKEKDGWIILIACLLCLSNLSFNSKDDKIEEDDD